MTEKEEPREEIANETITLKVRDQTGEEMFFKVIFSYFPSFIFIFFFLRFFFKFILNLF